MLAHYNYNVSIVSWKILHEYCNNNAILIWNNFGVLNFGFFSMFCHNIALIWFLAFFFAHLVLLHDQQLEKIEVFMRNYSVMFGKLWKKHLYLFFCTFHLYWFFFLGLQLDVLGCFCSWNCSCKMLLKALQSMLVLYVLGNLTNQPKYFGFHML